MNDNRRPYCSNCVISAGFEQPAFHSFIGPGGLSPNKNERTNLMGRFVNYHMLIAHILDLVKNIRLLNHNHEKKNDNSNPILIM